VSLQLVRHAWKVNECITVVNVYTASIQENNDAYRRRLRRHVDPGKPEGGIHRHAELKGSCTLGTPVTSGYHAVPVTSTLKLLGGRKTANSTQFTIVE
jgi:hypothetical protein